MDHDEYIRRARIARSRRPYRPSEDAYAQLERMNGRGIMDNRLLALGRRAIACRGWRWMEGIKYEAYDSATSRIVALRVILEGSTAPHECIPDLSDPATLGCLEALVTLANDGKCICYKCGDFDCAYWKVETPAGKWNQYNVESYADALVCALEAAP